MHESDATPLLVRWLISALALLITAFFIPGFRLNGIKGALIAAVVIGLANVIIWPILILLTLPINILTLGLFTFVVNGMVLKICAAILKDFEITSWFSAIIGGIVLAIANSFLHYLFR